MFSSMRRHRTPSFEIKVNYLHQCCTLTELGLPAEGELTGGRRCDNVRVQTNTNNVNIFKREEGLKGVMAEGGSGVANSAVE